MPTYDKEIIARYEEGDLPEEERRQFEVELQRDPALAEELALYREIKATLRERLPADERREALLGTLQRMRPLMSSSTSPASTGRDDLIGGTPNPLISIKGGKVTIRYLGAIAAAAVVVLVLNLVWRSGSADFERLGRTEMVSTTERGDNADSLLQQAALFFNKQQFSQALPLLDRAVTADSTNQLALFYRGVARWHTGSVEAARMDLEQVYNKGSLLKDEAAFFIALSFATEKNTPAARQWLDKIPEGSPIATKAAELSDKLR